MKRLILAAALCSAVLSPAYASSVPALSPEQAQTIWDNTMFLRACPTQTDPYAYGEELDGDCMGGQSGSPKDMSGGGG